MFQRIIWYAWNVVQFYNTLAQFHHNIRIDFECCCLKTNNNLFLRPTCILLTLICLWNFELKHMLVSNSCLYPIPLETLERTIPYVIWYWWNIKFLSRIIFHTGGPEYYDNQIKWNNFINADTSRAKFRCTEKISNNQCRGKDITLSKGHGLVNNGLRKRGNWKSLFLEHIVNQLR